MGIKEHFDYNIFLCPMNMEIAGITYVIYWYKKKNIVQNIILLDFSCKYTVW